MTTYGQQTPANELFDDITRQSSDVNERLALLSERSNLSAPAGAVAEVRERLWADYQAATGTPAR